MIYAACYNLATLGYFLDRPNITKQYGELLIANDYDSEDGKTLVENAKILLNSFDLNSTTSRHLDRNLIGADEVLNVTPKAFTENTTKKIEKIFTPSIIVKNDNSESEGYIINYNNDSPWEIQNVVEFVPIELYNDGKFDKKSKVKYDPKDLKAFSFNNKIYTSIQYADVESAKLSGIIAKKYFAEVAVNQKIKLLYFYEQPAGFAVGSINKIDNQEKILKNQPPKVLVLEEGQEKAKFLSTFTLEAIISKNEKIMKKYLDGSYSKDKQPVNTKRGLIDKLAARTELDENIDMMPLLKEFSLEK